MHGVQTSRWNGWSSQCFCLSNQNVFLTKESAEKALDVLNTHNRLLKKIMEINAENNWIPDWDDHDQVKYHVFWDNSTQSKSMYSSTCSQYASVSMCVTAKTYMMSPQVLDEDFKKFLFIYD
jgi:nitric oxide reductase large subunit